MTQPSQSQDLILHHGLFTTLVRAQTTASGNSANITNVATTNGFLPVRSAISNPAAVHNGPATLSSGTAATVNA